ncbi:Protein CBG00528 [Caenorhabditis briggsae]|uniref:Protein CBG00528 n=1 Tax=Caenorhabditis briggsae TaxID=6238 RepID=A8WNP2_CAEBR|nr:Protein CBG00528 [Caenorhabditis briggsae]CAP22097.2 Protein CBG00528 [Caenorhabditis briggsae]
MLIVEMVQMINVSVDYVLKLSKHQKNIDTLTAEGTPKRKGAIPPTKCEFSADCFGGADNECCPDFKKH